MSFIFLVIIVNMVHQETKAQRENEHSYKDKLLFLPLHFLAGHAHTSERHPSKSQRPVFFSNYNDCEALTLETKSFNP